MNPSRNYCEANVSKALTLLLDRLADRPIYTDEVVNDDLTVAHIFPTTWQELADRELVTARDGIGCCRYQLTGSGWREALKLTGELDAPEFQERLGRLNAVLKSLVHSRKESFAQTHIVASEARIPESWLFNILESGIWEHVQRRRGAVMDDSKTLVVVPPDFSAPLPSLHGSRRDRLKRPLPVTGTVNPRRAWAPTTSLIKNTLVFIGRYGRLVFGRERDRERSEKSLVQN
jgi:hypothetical protein